MRQRSRSGRILHADVSIASIVEDGILRGAVSINRDVTGLVEAELHRAEDERRMQALLDASRAMTAVFDRDGRIVAVNAAWTDQMSLGGLSGEAIAVGTDYVAAMRAVAGTSRMPRRCSPASRRSSAGVASFEWDYDAPGPEGSTTAWMVSVAPMPGSRGARSPRTPTSRAASAWSASWPTRPATTR